MIFWVFVLAGGGGCVTLEGGLIVGWMVVVFGFMIGGGGGVLRLENEICVGRERKREDLLGTGGTLVNQVSSVESIGGF